MFDRYTKIQKNEEMIKEFFTFLNIISTFK